jgi:uncharacterized membrane protein
VIPLVALAACAWLALIVFAPFLPVPLAGAAYLAGSLICHQLPERSFHLGGAQLPVCARCVGIYAGVALAIVMARRVRWSASRTAVAVAAVPTMATVLLEWVGLWHTSNAVRFSAGVPLGASVALVVVNAWAKVHYDSCASQRPIAPRLPPTPI